MIDASGSGDVKMKYKRCINKKHRVIETLTGRKVEVWIHVVFSLTLYQFLLQPTSLRTQLAKYGIKCEIMPPIAWVNVLTDPIRLNTVALTD